MKKEIRALLPMWAGAAVAIAASSLAFPEWSATVRMIYGLSSISLAAMSIGHEYLYGTLPSFLSIPASRGRLLAMKLAAVVPMLVTLGLLALALLPPDPRLDRNTAAPRLSLLCAVLTAPLLTMLCRSPLGGVVFSVGIIGFMQILEDNYNALICALLVISAVGVVGGWRAFMRLEATDGWSGDFSLPFGFGQSSNTTWLLIQKELWLQQASFVVAAAHLVFVTAYTIAMPRTPEVRGVLGAVGIIYAALVAILIGSLASAEERRMHTIEWQLLLPIAAWKPWTVKIVVVLTLALSMGLVLPFGLSREFAFSAWPVTIIVVLTVGSLYISTLCQSGLVALSWSTPVMLILVMTSVAWLAPRTLGGVFNPYVVEYPFMVGVTVLVVLALRLGYDNHRLARR